MVSGRAHLVQNGLRRSAPVRRGNDRTADDKVAGTVADGIGGADHAFLVAMIGSPRPDARRDHGHVRPDNAALLELAADVASNARIVSIYPVFDPHIPGGSALDGAVNIPIATTGHFRILGDERVIRAVETALG